MLKINYVVFLLIVLFSYSQLSFAGEATLADRPAVRSFIDMMVEKYNFNGPYLVRLFRQVKVRGDILALMHAPKESCPWFRYRHLFITDKRVDEGVAFWNSHEKTLTLAQEKYGVSPDIIVAIIGVETNYGKVTGSYRVIDALSTLAFNYPPRNKFFKKELEQYLILSREQNFDPLTMKGSYAGAMGLPQFMPSSYRIYAVSCNGSKKIDLLNNSNDAVLSVANYFKQHGWQGGELVVSPACVANGKYESLLNKNLTTPFTLRDLQERGVRPRLRCNENRKANIVALRKEDQNNEVWLCFNNFYVITEYNASVNYAMAAYELGQEIKRKRDEILATHDQNTIPAGV